LGGTSLNKGKRHPTIGNGVVLGSNAVVLGPIAIGDCSKIGSGAVVIKPVPADSTAVGVPARVIRGPHIEKPARPELDHARLPDPIAQVCNAMSERIRQLEEKVLVLERTRANLVVEPEISLMAPAIE